MKHDDTITINIELPEDLLTALIARKNLEGWPMTKNVIFAKSLEMYLATEPEPTPDLFV